MDSESKKEEIIKAATSIELHPCDFVDSNGVKGYTRIPMSEMSGMGAIIAEMLPQFRTAVRTTTVHTKGLWRCSFPSGVSGRLAQFKDGSGCTGTIINHGIKAQARWNPVHSVSATQSITLPISPFNIFMAATLVQMDHKLDKIQKTGEEILEYQKTKDRTEQEANFEELVDIYNKFKLNITNEKWQQLKYVEVQDIKRRSLARMKQLHAQIDSYMDKHDLVHTEQQTLQMRDKIQGDFQLYRLAVFMYAFAIFLETLLLGNFSREYLNSVSRDINSVTYGYKTYYSTCFNKMEHSSETTIKSKFLKGVAKASDNAGRTIHKIPIVEKGPLDEALVQAGKAVNSFNKKQTEKTLRDFRENMNSGAEQFTEEIDNINKLYNNPMTILFDNDNIYYRIKYA